MSKLNTNANISVEQFSSEVAKILDTYSYELEQNLVKTIKKFGYQTRDYITNESKQEIIDPKNRDKYVNCFTTEKVGNGLTRRLKNTEYRLSHLLENGHKVKNQYGGPYNIKKSKYGVGGKYRRKTHKHDFWHKTYDLIENELPQAIEKTVQDTGKQ